jgi:hypothetical protein
MSKRSKWSTTQSYNAHLERQRRHEASARREGLALLESLKGKLPLEEVVFTRTCRSPRKRALLRKTPCRVDSLPIGYAIIQNEGNEVMLTKFGMLSFVNARVNKGTFDASRIKGYLKEV